MGERSRQYVIVFGTLALMSIEGYSNVTKQHKIVGEFSNYPLETLVDWINDNTPQGKHSARTPAILAAFTCSNYHGIR